MMEIDEATVKLTSPGLYVFAGASFSVCYYDVISYSMYIYIS